MPRGNKVLTRQARKMVYDVHCFIKKETVEVVQILKLVKSQINKVTDQLEKNIKRAVTGLNQIQNPTEPSNIFTLNKTFNILEQIKQETAETIKAEVTRLEGVISNLKQNQKRTVCATRTSRATVSKISTQADNSGLLAVFRTPGKKRPRAKPVTDIDNFDQGVIKRCVHNFHLINKELPTIHKLKQKLQDDINYQGSEKSLRRIMKNLGFGWKKTENNRKILIETSNIRYQRIEFLRKINKYREEGRPVIYTDESYVDSSHTNPKAWTDGTSKGLKQPISKGQRVVIVHAGSEAGFIPNALLTFKAGTKSGDYHDNMNYQNYEKWLRTQLMPNLPPNSVVVVDNASYHNKQWDLAPTSNARKADMQAWLSEKGIGFNENLLKPQLYYLIKTNKDKFKTFSIDKILEEQNHSILRLPPYHPDLNPIEMAWSTIKQYVGSKNVKWNINRVIELVKEKVALMHADEWQALCNKVKNIEEQYAKSDHVVDMMTEQFIIQVNNDSSSGESSDSDISDDYEVSSSSDDEVPSTSAYGTHPFTPEDDLMEGISLMPAD